MKWLAFILAALIIVMFATQWSRWEGAARYETTDDAYLQSDVTAISAKVPGYVRMVPVHDYESVRAGQVLAELEDDDYRAAAARAAANVRLAEAQVRTYVAERARQDAAIRAAQAVLAASRADLAQSTRDADRAATLLRTGSGSSEVAERAATARLALIARVSGSRAQVIAATREMAVLDAQIQQARAQAQAARAALAVARINLGYTRIRAPADGVISQRQVFPGQFLPAGGQVTTLTPLPRVWVIANYRETQLTHVAVGDRAAVTIDTYPGHKLRAHVSALAPASGAEFALLPPDNATGNFTKIVQRFSVKLAIDDADGLRTLLRPGMSVIATIDTRSSTPVRVAQRQ